MNNFYVYVYLDPRKEGRFTYGNHLFGFEPFYVGKGFEGRWREHLSSYSIENDRNKFKNKKIKKLMKLGYDLTYYIVKIKINLLEKDALELEKEMIKLIGRHNLGLGPLTNLTDGGDGSTGFKFNEEQIKKLSERIKGNKFHLGHKHTDETKKILSEKLRISLKGLEKSENHRENLSKSLMGHKKTAKEHHTEETKKKMSQSALGRKMSKEQKEKLRIANLGKKQSQETIRKRMETISKNNKRKKRVTNEQVLEIRQMLLDGKKARDIAKIYNINEAYVSAIKLRKIFKNI